jgi:hypothetical protein
MSNCQQWTGWVPACNSYTDGTLPAVEDAAYQLPYHGGNEKSGITMSDLI